MEYILNSDIERLDGPPPATLYHYTSAHGLESILESGKIWSTDLEYLNDRRELHYGLSLVRQAMIDNDDARHNSQLADVLLNLRKHVNAPHMMVTCFCEHGDLLSQWRGYGSRDGYALGIDSVTAARVLEERGISRPFGAVSYDEDLSKKLAKVWARMLWEGWDDAISHLDLTQTPDPSDETVEEVAKVLYELNQGDLLRTTAACSYVKDPSFREEKEWRTVQAVFPSHDGTESRFLFRPGHLGLTPYIELDIRDETGKIPLSGVIVGPGEDFDLRATSLRLLLDQLGYDQGVFVESSSIPYRPNSAY